jgi:acyl-CoA synthetase (AMP-forming)/AMP-acid ligase II
MRRSGAVIHLVERYSTAYWEILATAAAKRRGLLVTALVARHIDFLDSLSRQGKLPVDEARLKDALRQTDILIGSAPVGPKTTERLLGFSGRLPHVRFGSTETCLQTMATPCNLPPDDLMAAFRAGWAHRYRGKETAGYYIGREHFPFTRVKVVRVIDPASPDYFHPCEVGEPGYIVTQGPNIMSGYVGDPAATREVFREGWYTGLRDVVFSLRNQQDGQMDYYWVSRDSELLIRGGANYAYDQIAAELSGVLVEDFRLKPEQFRLAVVGLRLGSEHEDICCVTIELNPELTGIEAKLRDGFIEKAAGKVPKWARPQHLRLSPIPLTFKGAVHYPRLRQDFLDSLSSS